MKGYIINLKKDEKKLKKCLDNLKFLKESIQLERFEAVYGKELDPEYLKNNVHPYVQYTIKNGRNTDSDIGSLGAIGCSLSHISLWEKISNDTSGEDMFLIFEDDAAPIENIDKKLSDLIQNLPEKWDIILLGYQNPHLYENNIEKVGDFYKIKSVFFGTHAYLINKKGAKKLLKRAIPVREHVDSYICYMCMMSSDDAVEGYRPSESIFIQDNAEVSGISTGICIKCLINRLSNFEILLIITGVVLLILLIFLFFISR